MGLIVFGAFLGILTVVAQFVMVGVHNDQYRVRDGKEPAKYFNWKIAVGTFIVPVVLMTALSSTRSVGTGEIAVMTRFGRVTGQELGEGFHIKNPLDKANVYDVKVLKIQTDAAAASKDLQDVNGTLVINYQLEAGRVSELHQNVGNLFQEKLINPTIQEVFKAVTAQYDATQLITDRNGVKNAAYEELRDRLASYGVQIRELNIVNFSFSEEFTNAIEAKQVAQQQAEQAKFNAQKAEEDAQATVNRAKGEAEAQRLQQQTLTDPVLEKLFLDKWDGKLPLVAGGEGNLLDISSLINNQ